jgi:hypothetical protein
MGELISHRLGNFALIGLLRERLAETRERFPLLLTQVLYDFGHAGDHLTPDQVRNVATEVEILKTVRGRGAHEEALIRHFEGQMLELVEASLRVGKPIEF